ncbi:MAG: hypothetical protein ACRC1U_04300, partial [Vibrionaceae bacterium]
MHTHSPSAPALALHELQQLLLGSFGEYRARSFSALMTRLRNTNETPRTQRPTRSQLQVIQQKLQAQHAATPINAVPADQPTRQQLQSVLRALACYEDQASSRPQIAAPDTTQAYLEACQALHVNVPAVPVNASARLLLTDHSRAIIATTGAQRRLANNAVTQLKPLLTRHTVFTASTEQRTNLFLHFNTLINSKLQPSLPRSQNELELFINQRDSRGANTRLDYLQIMTACLRGSPNAAISAQINALLNSKLTQRIKFEHILVPCSVDNMSGDAILRAFASLTPDEKRLFLLKFAQATLKICQIVTQELTQARAQSQTRPQAEASTPSAPSTLPRRQTTATAPLRPTRSLESVQPRPNANLAVALINQVP